MSNPATHRLSNIKSMNLLNGYDFVIVCTSNAHQERYWQGRLEATRGQVTPASSVILAVHEDWEGGAGNGLGTLYAFEKAVAKAAESGVDLMGALEAGKSVAMFHTAGKGTRLAPLPGAENNNKPGVKLPGSVVVDGKAQALTILEAVVKQTGLYAASRGGRLSVFWGDQVFVPSAPAEYDATHHADILCSLAPMPTAEEWAAKGLERYGLIGVNQSGDAAQVEKVTHGTATRLLASLGEIASVGTSLGSFSVSAALLKAMLGEFAADLAAKTGKLDADPHFWMPMTLARPAYIELMEQKGTSTEAAATHFDRIARMLGAFGETGRAGKPLFGAVDVGASCYWWDYGQLHLYLRNNLLATKATEEASALRLFLGLSLPEGVTDPAATGVAVASTVKGLAPGSLSICSAVGEADVRDAMLVNVTAKKVSGHNCLLYNVVDDSEEGVALEDGQVRADIFVPGMGKIVMLSTTTTHGGDAWKVTLDGNTHSFESIYKLNHGIDIAAAQADADAAHAAAAAAAAL